jgi:hypothetical protein
VALGQAVDLLERVGHVRVDEASLEDEPGAFEGDEAEERLNSSRLQAYLAEFVRTRFVEGDLEKRRTVPSEALRRDVRRVIAAMLSARLVSSGSIRLPPTARSLLFDVALVVFHQAYFGLLDRLSPDGEEREALLAACSDLADSLPDRADRYRVAALVAERYGDRSYFNFARHEELRSTDPASHDFLTRLQSVWGDLVEDGRIVSALLLLGQHAPDVSTSDYEEYRELVLETVDLARSVRFAG